MKSIGRLGTTVLGIYLIVIAVAPYIPAIGPLSRAEPGVGGDGSPAAGARERAGGGHAGPVQPGGRRGRPRPRAARRAGPPRARQAPRAQAPGRGGTLMFGLLAAALVLASF